MDKIELKNKIRQLEGLTNDEKSALIEMLNHQKKYGLVWEDKPEDVEERLRDELPVLHEIKERTIISEADNAPNHILIEGDNLEALTALSYTHAGKIDVIYIDPPYNTGNKDFVYNDSFVDSEDAFRHSKWLSFMNKRLKLAKGLLSDRGVIFISIDDNEQAQLKLLCDEVFGRDKFVANLIWQKKTGAADAKGIATITEYILLYCTNIPEARNIFNSNKEAFDIKRYRYTDEFVKDRGPFYYDSLDRGSIQYSDGLNYGIEAPDGSLVYPNGRSQFVNDGWTWKWSKDKVQWGIKNKFIEIVPTKKKANGWAVKYKIYLNVDNEGKTIDKSVPFKNLITGVLNADAANDIKNMFGGKAFNYAKPKDLIIQLLKFIKKKKSTILDFFAGSGTTLHATMQLNKEDGGHRKCILVTNNENGICENVTYERNKRVINGYTTPKGEQVEGLYDNTLRYYKTDFISRDQSPKNMRALVAVCTDLLCIKNDIYTEAPFAGKRLNPKYVRYFEDKRRRMLVIYDERAIAAIAKFFETVEIDERGKIKVYTFSPSRYAFDDEFLEVADKVELCALPAAIYDAYRRVLPKRKPKYLPEALVEGDAASSNDSNKPIQGELDFDKKGGQA